MTITFKDEMDLVKQLEKTDINLLSFSILLMDSMGVVLSKSNQSKIDSRQQKRKTEQNQRDLWISTKSGKVLHEKDIPDWIEAAVMDSANLTVHDAIQSSFGNIKPGSMFSRDIYQLSSEYIFTPDGLESIMYKFFAKGWITKEQYQKWSESN